MNRRRKLLFAFCTSALAAPFASFAQLEKIPRIGFLGATTASSFVTRVDALRAGLRELGYVEGKNIAIELRWADGNYERLPILAAELVQMKVDVIVAATTPGTSAAQKATTTIPIVMTNVADPVGSGFVASLARPGGNITGFSNIASDISPKQLEMLLSIKPKLSRVAVLVNPGNVSHAVTLKYIQAGAQRTGIKVLSMDTRTPQEIENAFSVMVQKKAGAVIVARDPFFTQHLRQIAELAAKYRLPSISGNQEYAEIGGLMSYGPSIIDSFRRAATYVEKILKGAKPGDLPVEQPTKFELLINGKTAKALGLTIPQSLLISADRVIE